ncbi:serine/threonine-protein kinase, partial [Agromyces allii]|uniref:serine/threonine-protein kinase n=1 Tax=Agromyces allii TaxID=393607 RepID=UPI0012FC2747
MNARSGLVSGRYRLGELLGSGGSASAFAAVDVETGERVALKVLHPHLSEAPAARDAFLAEARRMQSLRHPNIAGVLDVGVHDGSGDPIAWIALELAGGMSLSEHVERHGPLPVAEALSVADGVLRALEAAHADGLIHRDVSPANVMVAVDAHGRLGADGVRLLDFGLADAAGRAAVGDDILRSETAHDDAREPGPADGGPAGVIGNVAYMSPEQLRGEPVDERGDLYQVGGLLHFALTGRAPFPRTTPGATMRAHLGSPPPVPSVLDSRIPRDVDRIVVRAMLKDPADRFADAAAMRSAVEAAIPGAVGAAGAAGAAGLGTMPDAPPFTAASPDAVRTRMLGSTRLPTSASASGSADTTAVIARAGRPAGAAAGR